MTTNNRAWKRGLQRRTDDTVARIRGELGIPNDSRVRVTVHERADRAAKHIGRYAKRRAA